MDRPTRRQVIAGALGAGAGFFLPPSLKAAPRETTVGELARRIRKTPRKDVLGLVEEAMSDGVESGTFDAAIYLAGVHDISPWPCGNDLHAVMVMDSVHRIGARAGARDRWLATLWSLDHLKSVVPGRGLLLGQPPADAAELSATQAREELRAGLERWDWRRADRGVTAAVRHLDRSALFEIIWPHAGRCGGSLAHKIIHAAQADRTLEWAGPVHAVATMRSVVRGILFRGGRLTSASDRARRVLDRIPESWMKGAEKPEASAELLRGLRDASFAQAQDLVIAAFADGLGPQTVWDGLRLFASELFARRTTDDATEGGSILPVHTVTSLHGFGHAWRRTRNDRTRRLLVLQAAGWLPQLERQAVRRVGLARKRRGLAVPYDEPSRQGDAAMPHDLFRGTVESHQYKLAAALREEAAHAAPRWRAHIVGAARGYLAPPGCKGTAFLRRAEAMLEKRGLR